jgi:AbiV family abortive infection protein
VDLRAVKAASRTELSACAYAAARNVQGLVHDAEVLAGAGSTARAYSLAAFAIEECGKSAYLTVLALVPKKVRTRAHVGRMLQWHQLKQVGGLLMAAISLDPPGLAAKLAAMPAAQCTQILSALGAPADEADRLKRRGLYVDMDRAGRIREPSEITDADLIGQLERARQVAAAAALLLKPEAQARLANPPAEAMKLARALVDVLAEAGYERTPEAATDILLNAISKLRDGMAVNYAQAVPRARRSVTAGEVEGPMEPQPSALP